MIPEYRQRTSFAINTNDKSINSFSECELFGTVIGNILKFKTHIENLCRKAPFKMQALCRIFKLLTVKKAKMLTDTFINSQFNFAQLTWMFPGETSN